MKRDKKGILRWKKVGVRIQDHLIVPTFPTGLTRESFDGHLREYLSNIGCKKFSGEKPLWEVHLVKYPSSNVPCTVIFKCSHALGDGYSFISVFFKCCKRADKSSTPLTFPRLSLVKTQQPYDGNRVIGLGKKLLGLMRKCMNTSYVLMESLLRITILEDQPSAIRSKTSENMKIELFRPFNIHSVTLSLERVKQVKTKLGAVMQLTLINSMTICVMLNMRIYKGFTNIEDIREDAWGNHSSLLFIPLPTSTNVEEVNPLDLISKAKDAMDRKKNSMVFYLIDSLLSTAMWTKGQKGIDDMMYSSFKNATTLITSLIGPKEQMAFLDHPVSSFYYFVSGVPQSITFTSVSCMEQLKLVVTMEKSFIDSELFISCMDEAFENIFRAAFENYPGREGNEIKKKSN
ncbi:hypothetical protein MKW98_005062 [Papaver atlanticum]|uniref:Diacylglycerol O-acyltransferase n=1 Tax=Papaver atlanticum TaxID=357466 RepID=A0AAD4TDD3_9MAGN|nr:hypothetical protein MKW98_005062 [Papaver atlanticum]